MINLAPISVPSPLLLPHTAAVLPLPYAPDLPENVPIAVAGQH